MYSSDAEHMRKLLTKTYGKFPWDKVDLSVLLTIKSQDHHCPLTMRRAPEVSTFSDHMKNEMDIRV